MKFTILKKSITTKARLGSIETAHGMIDTPIFMPVGTRGVVKTMTNQQLLDIHTQIILGNTYHLMLKPGMKIMEEAGGLHKLMRWDLPILTDSGGFQVFSLSELNQVTAEGVFFRSHIDGSKHFLGPLESMQIQKTIGSDIVMAFDQCVPYPCTREEAEDGVTRTTDWAKLCRHFTLGSHQNLFGIIQGGMYSDLRKKSAEELTALPFEGYAIGGLSVGEPEEMMYQVLEETVTYMPDEKPRYLMGVGTPRNIIEAVLRGVDMFDCVMPTRNARNGTAFTWQGKIPIKAGRFADDFSPLDPELDCYASQFSKAYIRHLINVDEITGLTLVTMQNLAFYLDFMKQLRQAIEHDTIDAFYEKVCKIYP